MQKNIADIVSEICEARVTGILSLSLKNDSALFKIFFRNGAIYLITHSTCKDRECLMKMSEHQFLTGLFMPGAQVDTHQNGSSIPSDEVILILRKANKTIEWSGQWDGRVRAPGKDGISTTIVDSGIIAQLEEELVNVAGPVGPMVLAQAYDSCGLKPGQSITRTEFQRLVLAISGKLPDEQKIPFLKKFN
ncbi:MAG: hypothetical protein A2010_17430 [Nitrospirae bacterium GWD2_57_9]|nr:MAG: hypothetical protein A2010_17430 [Nitrospirae bacterium GWD2_57_9]